MERVKRVTGEEEDNTRQEETQKEGTVGDKSIVIDSKHKHK